MEALRVWGMPYLMPTPTRGSVFITRFTVAWSGKAKNTDAGKMPNLRSNEVIEGDLLENLGERLETLVKQFVSKRNRGDLLTGTAGPLPNLLNRYDTSATLAAKTATKVQPHQNSFSLIYFNKFQEKLQL